MAIKDKAAFTAAIFNRLAVGGNRGERYRVAADKEPDADEVDAIGQAYAARMLTPRQCMQTRQTFYFLREAKRRAASATAAAAVRECCDDGRAHQWKPDRPPRRSSL